MMHLPRLWVSWFRPQSTNVLTFSSEHGAPHRPGGGTSGAPGPGSSWTMRMSGPPPPALPDPLVGRPVRQLVGRPGPEPVPPRAAGQHVGRAVIGHGRGAEPGGQIPE